MKPFYKFLTNTPVKIVLKYDKAFESQGQYGPYWKYTVMINGEAETIAASPDLHDLLKDKKKGDAVEVVKASQLINGKEVTKFVLNNLSTSSKVIQEKVAHQAETTEQEKWDNIAFGKCKTLFLVEAFKNGDVLKDVESICEKWAEACMRKLCQEGVEKDTFGEDEINVGDGIPF